MGDPLTEEYRRSRGWAVDPGPTTRISCELPRDLVRRLNAQSTMTGLSRSTLIESALLALVRAFESIDKDEDTRG